MVFPRPLVLDARGDARLVVVFEEAQLVVVLAVERLLEVQLLGPLVQQSLAGEKALEALPHVILVFDVKGVEGLAVARGGKALAAGEVSKAQMDALGQPHAAGIDLGHGPARRTPEVQRHERGHVAAKAVDDRRPEAERFDLIVPERAVAIVKVDDVGPVADLVADLSRGVAVIKVRMLAEQHGVGRGVVVDHVDHDLHAAAVDLVAEEAELLHAAVDGIGRAVVAVGIGAAEASLFALFPDRMDRQKPDPVGAERADTVKVRDD